MSLHDIRNNQWEIFDSKLIKISCKVMKKNES